MLHVTFMGGAEVRVKEQDNMIITVCGGTDILLPTIAEKILYLNRTKKKDQEDVIRRSTVITLMGGTITKYPTLGREIMEMVQLRESGMFSDEELTELWQEALQQDDLDTFEFFTLMGGAGEEYPGEKEEIQALKELMIAGIINQDQFKHFSTIIRNKEVSFREPAGMENLREILLPPRPLVEPSQKRILLTNSSLNE